MKRGFFKSRFWHTAYVCLLVVRKFIAWLAIKARKEDTLMKRVLISKQDFDNPENSVVITSDCEVVLKERDEKVTQTVTIDVKKEEKKGVEENGQQDND